MLLKLELFFNFFAYAIHVKNLSLIGWFYAQYRMNYISVIIYNFNLVKLCWSAWISGTSMCRFKWRLRNVFDTFLAYTSIFKLSIFRFSDFNYIYQIEELSALN